MPLNRIAYVDLQGRLCTIAPDGSRGQRLSDNGLLLQYPAWSPDGRHLAAIGAEPGGSGVYTFTEKRGVFSRAAQKELYYGQVQAPLYLRWSPVGDRLGFLVGYPQSIGLYLADLKAVTSTLVETGQPFFWDWMPDGAYLLVHSGGRAPGGRLLFIDTDGEDWGQEVAPPGYFQAPAISSDGRLWAFAEQDIGGQSFLTIEHHLTGERIALAHEGVVAMGWGPGGTHLAAISPIDDSEHFFGPLRLIDGETGTVRTMTDDTVVAFFWSPDGRHLAYWTLADGVSPSGALLLNLWLLDVADGGRSLLLTYAPPPGFIEQFLPIFDQFAHSHRLWAPGGDALVLTVARPGTVEVVVVPIDGRPPVAVAQGVMAAWSPV
jgi:TolB protein